MSISIPKHPKTYLHKLKCKNCGHEYVGIGNKRCPKCGYAKRINYKSIGFLEERNPKTGR
jgi:ribosomal protein L37E